MPPTIFDAYLQFQSTRPARGATHLWLWTTNAFLVSIHAPRAGRDCPIALRLSSSFCFNPRAPRGARLRMIATTGGPPMFQSTRPARGATRASRTCGAPPRFNPRAPRGARLGRLAQHGLEERVSIHAPRAGRDDQPRHRQRLLERFNPRAPRGARLREYVEQLVRYRFNPRAPRGARPRAFILSTAASSFNPRAPRGARPTPFIVTAFDTAFQSTRPARGATIIQTGRLNQTEFQSTRPARGATAVPWPSSRSLTVSIHAPRAGRDGLLIAAYPFVGCFNPRAPRGARLADIERKVALRMFQSTRPARGATCP